MPIHSSIKKSDHHQILIWRLDESVSELLSQINITKSDKKTADAFRLDKRKKEWLATRLMFQNALGHYPEIAYSENGKPVLKGSTTHISISHTNGFVAISLSDKPTALDIELCSPRVNKVADRFVHSSEKDFIQDAFRMQYLTTIWCAKETLYKYHNQYGVIFNEQFKISPFEIKKCGILDCEFIHQEQTHQNQLHFEINDDYTLVYC